MARHVDVEARHVDLGAPVPSRLVWLRRRTVTDGPWRMGCSLGAESEIVGNIGPATASVGTEAASRTPSAPRAHTR